VGLLKETRRLHDREVGGLSAVAYVGGESLPATQLIKRPPLPSLRLAREKAALECAGSEQLLLRQ
jgi:hypothetical protein